MSHRNWTEIATNFVTLSDSPRTWAELTSILEPGGTPIELLPAYLHEATHHWTFGTPVGQALAHLRLRAAAGVNIHVGPSDEARIGYEAAIAEGLRCQVATELLKPMIEGVALFMEFNAVSRGEARSSPMTTAVHLFGEPAGYDDKDRIISASVVPELWRTTQESLLLSMRTDPATLERKINVLCSALHDDPDTYLLGYLAVTAMRLWLVRRGCVAFDEDSDLFAVYLVTFFFWDPGLVERLLFPTDSSQLGQCAEDIRSHLQGRIMQLLRDVDGDHISEFLTWSRATDQTSFRNADWHGWEPQGLATTSEATIGEMFERIRQATIEHDTSGMGRYHNEDVYLSLMHTRQLLALSAFPVELEVREDSAFAVIAGEDRRRLSQEALASLKQWDEGDVTLKGTVAVVVDAALPAPDPALVISSEHRMLEVIVGDNHRAESLPIELLEELEGRPPLATEFASSFSERLEECLRQDEQLSKVAAWTTRARIALWEYIGLLGTGDSADYDSLVSSMKEFGLFDVFSGEREVIEAYAQASLLSSVTPYSSIIRPLLELAGHDFEMLLDELESIRERWGLLTVYESGSRKHGRLWLAP